MTAIINSLGNACYYIDYSPSSLIIRRFNPFSAATSSFIWELESIYDDKPRQLMFGSNENLIFVLIGASSNSIISLIDDSTGRPVVRWSLQMNEGTGTLSGNHIVSNLKQSVGTGQDMIALANGGA
jgi:hypothetical protein